MSEDKKILDLDELFGNARTVKLRWQGKEYGLLRMEGISPKQLSQFNALYTRSNDLRNELLKGNAENEEKLSIEIDKLLCEMLSILCPELPVDSMPFVIKLRAVSYYVEQTQGKKALEAALKTIGETSSAA